MAANRGFGTVNLDEIDFVSEVTAPLAEFDTEQDEAPEIISTVRETACEQGLFYRDGQKDIVDRYRDNFIYMQDGEVVWHGPDPSNIRSHREFSGRKPGSALWLKLVDPEEREGEKFDVYEDCLAAMSA